jgi:hypothetical protein
MKVKAVEILLNILSASFYLHNWGNMLIFAAELPKY